MSAVVETRPQGKPIGAWYNGAAVVGGLLALFAIFLVPTIEPALLRAEHWAADWRTAWLSGRMPSSHPKVAIVRITEESVADFPYFLPVNRGYFADIVDAVDKAGARTIGLDFYFTRDTEKQFDDKLRETLRRLKDKLVVGVYERGRPQQLQYQYDFIGDTPAGYIDLRRETDHVVRYRAYPRSEGRYQESFSSRVAKASGWTGTEPPDRIGWLLPPKDGSDTFLTINAHSLVKATTEQNRALLKDRIVLIGGDLYTLDRHWTPLSIRDGKQTVGVEVHAQMVAELLDGDRSYRETRAADPNRLPAGAGRLGHRPRPALPGAQVRLPRLARGELRRHRRRLGLVQAPLPGAAVHARRPGLGRGRNHRHPPPARDRLGQGPAEARVRYRAHPIA